MDLINLKQAARILKKHPETVRRYHRAGKLKGIKYGEATSPLMFIKKDIEKFRIGK